MFKAEVVKQGPEQFRVTIDVSGTGSAELLQRIFTEEHLSNVLRHHPDEVFNFGKLLSDLDFLVVEPVRVEAGLDFVEIMRSLPPRMRARIEAKMVERLRRDVADETLSEKRRAQAKQLLELYEVLQTARKIAQEPEGGDQGEEPGLGGFRR